MTDQLIPAEEPAAEEPAAEGPAAEEPAAITGVEAAGPTTFEQPQGPAPGPSVKDRRFLRALARWSVAVVLCGGLGAGTALAVTGQERTDLPGLSTRSDGRWDYPRVTLPALPSGSPRPFSEPNTAQVHYADLRDLLLPAPAGASTDKKLDGGWVSTAQYLGAYEKDERGELAEALRDAAVRHIAARGWTMPDGTSSRVYLLQFTSVAYANDYANNRLDLTAVPGRTLKGVREADFDEDWDGSRAPEDTSEFVFTEQKPYGATQVRQAYITAGDTVALIVQEKKGGTAVVPFHQTVLLQDQLLG